MAEISRRTLLGAAAALPAIATLGGIALAPSARAATLVYEAGLPEGRRFAKRAVLTGRAATALEGDPIRQAMAMLADRPHALWGVTRFSDSLLFEEAAREAGYRPLAVIRHDVSGHCHARCLPEAESIATLARQARRQWPERFAELATGSADAQTSIPASPSGGPQRSAATSWVFVRRGA